MIQLFTPFSIGNLQLKNRIIMAPMQRWQGTPEGFATDYHINHYGTRASSGLGLIIIESTTIAENGRLFQNDISIFSDDHIAPLNRVVQAIHKNDTPVVIQLCHGGRKSSPENKGKMLAPSSIAFDDFYGVPHEMTTENINEVKEEFVKASRRAIQAGFDGIELHAAHGYLLHQFLSPLSNKRTDKYGGSLVNRARFLREVFRSIREEVGIDYPIIVRVSASDYEANGVTPEMIGETLQLLAEDKLDAVHVSSGGLTPKPPPSVYPGYQIPYARVIKKMVNCPVIAVGKIHTKELANQTIADNHADLIAIGEPLLEDPDYIKNWMKE